MTDTEAGELNAKVAAVLGWKAWSDDKLSAESTIWDTPNGDTIQYEDSLTGLPDFARDGMEIGHLVGWVLSHRNVIFYIDNDEVDPAMPYRSSVGGVSSYDLEHIGAGYSPSEALCLAIIGYAEAEGEVKP